MTGAPLETAFQSSICGKSQIDFAQTVESPEMHNNLFFEGSYTPFSSSSYLKDSPHSCQRSQLTKYYKEHHPSQ
tara:strand:- start:2579 stop:2800 length:222 start_codon:yes stop_codon:yes gene_type:complete